MNAITWAQTTVTRDVVHTGKATHAACLASLAKKKSKSTITLLHTWPKMAAASDSLLNFLESNTSRFLQLATWVSYYAVPLWLLQVTAPLRVLWGYSAATACAVALQSSVRVAWENPHNTLTSTATCKGHMSSQEGESECERWWLIIDM